MQADLGVGLLQCLRYSRNNPSPRLGKAGGLPCSGSFQWQYGVALDTIETFLEVPRCSPIFSK